MRILHVSRIPWIILTRNSFDTIAVQYTINQWETSTCPMLYNNSTRNTSTVPPTVFRNHWSNDRIPPVRTIARHVTVSERPQYGFRTEFLVSQHAYRSPTCPKVETTWHVAFRRGAFPTTAANDNYPPVQHSLTRKSSLYSDSAGVSNICCSQ